MADAKTDAKGKDEGEKKVPVPRRFKNHEAKVTVIAEGNPKREGSKSALRFAKYPKTPTAIKTILEITDGPTIADIGWDLDHGLIKVEGEEPRPLKKAEPKAKEEAKKAS